MPYNNRYQGTGTPHLREASEGLFRLEPFAEDGRPAERRDKWQEVGIQSGYRGLS